MLCKVQHAMIWIRGLLDRWLLQSLLSWMVCASDLLVDPLLVVLRIVLLSSAARLLIIEVVIRLRLHSLGIRRPSCDSNERSLSGLSTPANSLH